MDGKFRNEAKRLAMAIKKMGENDACLDNFESYLAYCFEDWIKLHASLGVASFVLEFETFAELE